MHSSGWILRIARCGSCCPACPIPFRQARPAGFPLGQRGVHRGGGLYRELPVADALNKTAAGGRAGGLPGRLPGDAFAGEELLASALTEPQRQQLMQAIDQLKARA